MKGGWSEGTYRKGEDEEERRRRACKMKEKGINEMRGRGIWVYDKGGGEERDNGAKEFWGNAGLKSLATRPGP